MTGEQEMVCECGKERLEIRCDASRVHSSSASPPQKSPGTVHKHD